MALGPAIWHCGINTTYHGARHATDPTFVHHLFDFHYLRRSGPATGPWRCRGSSTDLRVLDDDDRMGADDGRRFVPRGLIRRLAVQLPAVFLAQSETRSAVPQQRREMGSAQRQPRRNWSRHEFRLRLHRRTTDSLSVTGS